MGMGIIMMSSTLKENIL